MDSYEGGALSRGLRRQDVTLGRAVVADAGTAADVYLRSRKASFPHIPPSVHPDEAARAWFAGVVVPQRETWLAESNGAVVGVMVLHGNELDQLYVHPDWFGRGVGSLLVELALRRRPDGLTLWTFRDNERAQRFYERHGFVAVERTDGSRNEEGAPDVRYAWSPSTRVRAR